MNKKRKSRKRWGLWNEKFGTQTVKKKVCADFSDQYFWNDTREKDCPTGNFWATSSFVLFLVKWFFVSDFSGAAGGGVEFVAGNRFRQLYTFAIAFSPPNLFSLTPKSFSDPVWFWFTTFAQPEHRRVLKATFLFTRLNSCVTSGVDIASIYTRHKSTIF